MKNLNFEIQPQPDDTTCGPTCLHAIYRYFGDDIPLEQVVAETPSLEHGGTLAVSLACHALTRGYQATIYTYNLTLFDPTWFASSNEVSTKTKLIRDPSRLIEKLERQLKKKDTAKLRLASRSYIEFLKLGGQLRMQDLNATLLRRFLKRSTPILTALSSTYLYQTSRELPDGTDDDVGGVPAGHFVVLSDYDKQKRLVRVADPYAQNPFGMEHNYEVCLDRLICAILLGVLTYDAKLLIIEPQRRSRTDRS